MYPLLESKIVRRMCPDIPPEFDKYMVQNEDSNEEFRKSISIDVI